MNYIKFLKFTIVVCAVFLMTQTSVMATTIPLPDIAIVIKSVSSGGVIVSNTDKNGNFYSAVQEEQGEYNVFINDESTSPFKIKAKNSTISGRIVILTEGTTTQDPVPVKTKTTKTVKTTKILKDSKSVNKATSTSIH